MDLIFNCPECGQELEVDASGAGEEIECPSCRKTITIPEPSSPAAAPAEGVRVEAQPVNPIAASAAAKEEKHLRVPVHTKPPEKLIAKVAVPLEVAAKESDKKLRTKCIRHLDCVEVGHDRFDENVTAFLAKIGEANLISLTPINYSYVDISSQKILADFGVMIVYRG